MKIRKIVILMVVIGILAISAGLFFSSQFVFLEGFKKIETADSVNDLDRAVNSLNNMLLNLKAITTDWAYWDDTYEYIQTKNPEYIRANLVDETFPGLNLNIILFFDRDGNSVYGKAYDLQNESQTEVPESLIENLRDNSLIGSRKTADEEYTGVVMLPEGPVAVALLPILQSNDEGPSRGKMLMGFYIDGNIVNSVSESTVVDFSLHSYKSPDVFTGLMMAGAPQKTAGYPLTLISDDENSVSSVTLIPDMYGNPALFARVDEPRDIFRQGINSLHLFFILTCIITIVSGLVLYSIILRMYIARIEDMEERIKEIGDRKDFSRRLNPQGHDELTTFTSSVNSMLSSLEEQQEEIGNTKKRLMLALSGAKVIIWDLNITDMIVNVIRPEEEGIWYPFETDTVHINDMLKYTHPGDIEPATKTFRDHIAGKTDDIHTDFRIGRPGNWAWVTLLAKVSSTDNDGNPSRITGIMMDITEKEDYHQALIIANKKLNILSDVTRHDVLNQITALHGYSELMEDDYEENPEIMRYIKNLKRLINTIEQQIAFTKNYQEMGIRKPAWQNLNNVIISSSLNQLGGIIRPDVNVGDMEIFADQMLEKVFFNLIGNSKQHGENVTEISITFHESDKNGIIVFSDNGIGIPAEKKEKIFEKGYGGSSGYGLFLAREILSITGIDIIETGEEGRGARFEIIVPEGLYRFPGKTEKNA